METKDYWQLFLETGAPELYLLYSRNRRLENAHVSDHKGPGDAGHGLQ